MSRGPENNFISSVHKHLPVNLYRMKNHNAFHGGIADVWYSGVSDLWAEYKFITVPKRPDTVIDLISGKDPAISWLQQEWLTSRHKEGRNVGVIIGSKDGGIWLPGMAWKQTFTASQFLQHLMHRRALADTLLKEIQQHG